LTSELAVVVVNYNAGEYLSRCLRSVFASSGDLSLDVAVVDNGSRDGSATAAAAANPRARLVENESNLGFAAGANVGIRATEAPFILFLNPDAEIVSGTLASLVKVADERPDAGAVGPLVRNPDGTIQPSARRVPRTFEALMHAFLGPVEPGNPWTRAYTMADWDRTTEREVEWISGSAMLLRRRALHDVGVFDEGYFMYVEDVDLCTRLRRSGWAVMFSPELEVIHEMGVSARGQSRRMAGEHSRSIYRYFSKHRAHGPAVLLKPFVRGALAVRTQLVARGRR
jgi:N-acetylglucosaminyl-diphospho-decaprenol L-rhamnosyltransferase